MSEPTPNDSEGYEPPPEDREFERLIHEALRHKGWAAPYPAEGATMAAAQTPHEPIPPVDVHAILNRGRIGMMPIGSPEDVRQVVERARQAQPAREALSFKARGRVLLDARRIMHDEMDDIARLISRETGKPVSDIIATEIEPALELIRGLAGSSERLLKSEFNKARRYGRAGRAPDFSYSSLGVIGVISSRHFPWALPVGEIVMALMTGNAVVLKPSKLTPFTGLKIEDVFTRAGLPEGVLQVVMGDGLTSQALAQAGVDKIFFTGSVAAGRRVAESAAKHPTPVVFNLNGKIPLIVLEDAEVEAAADAIVNSVFGSPGQDILRIERCYVHRNVTPQFNRRVAERVQALRQSERQGAGSVFGLSETDIRRHVGGRVREAVERGARVMAGGRRRRTPGGFVYEPTLLADVDHSMPIVYEETLGLVLSIITYDTEDEAFRLVNDGAPSLTASIWTRDVGRGRLLARGIQASTVLVNEVPDTSGASQSSREGMKHGIWGRMYGQFGLADFVSTRHKVPFAPAQPRPWSRRFAYVPHTACLLLAVSGYVWYKYRKPPTETCN